MRKLQQGFTLIEILVSLSLLAFILFQFDGMQVAALKQTEANYFFRIASDEMDSMYERLYAVKNNHGLLQQIARWQAHIHSELPQAKAEIEGNFPLYRLTISWNGFNACDKTRIGFSGCLAQTFQLPT